MNKTNKINYLDLFSGIGGFHLGLLQGGLEFNWVGHSEIDKYAKQVYHKHFPKSEDLGDVKNIKINTIEQISGRPSLQSNGDMSNTSCTGGQQFQGEYINSGAGNIQHTTTITTENGNYTINGRINLITFGFPCQDLSIAGKRRGLSASRSGLFFEAMQIIRDAKPDYFIFENVKGLFSSSEGRDFEIVLRTVADSGYDGQWQLLNTRWFLPQNRERIYFVGHIRGRSRPKIFPIGKYDETFNGIKTRTKSETQLCSTISTKEGSRKENNFVIAHAIDANYHKGQSATGHCQRTMVKDNKGGNNLIMAWSKSHRTGKSEADKKRKNYGQVEHRIKTDEFNSLSCGEGCGNQSTQNFITATQIGMSQQFGTHTSKNCFMTIRSCEPNGVSIGSSIRRLTPIECERLQGFPDNWTEGISDTQRYKCLGNAVTVNVVKAVAEKLLKEAT